MICKQAQLVMLGLLILLPVPGRAQDDVTALVRMQDAREIATVVKSLPVDQQSRLQRLNEQFANLPKAEQNRLRQLHRELWESEHGSRLYGVLERYRDWLATLSAGQRDDVLSLPIEERVAAIERIKNQQHAERFANQAQGLVPSDTATVGRWLRDYVVAHEQDFLKLLSPDMRKRITDSKNPQRRTRSLMILVGKNQLMKQVSPPRPEEFDELIQRLSPTAKKRLESATDGQARIEIVHNWMEASLNSRVRFFKISAEMLDKFYTKELNPDQQERLDRLPATEMQSELRRMFIDSRMKRMMDQGGPGHEGRERGRGGPPHMRDDGQPPPFGRPPDGPRRRPERRSERRPGT